jgi:SAM-dependent methyltransferase
MKEKLKNISSNMIKRYSDRYNKLGYDVKTLGWGNKEQQYQRFDDILNIDLILNNKTLLDIGCGFGDFYTYLKSKNINFNYYTGVDINSNLIKEANKLHKDNIDCHFDVYNVLDDSGIINNCVDIAYLIGVLNLNFKNEIDNYEYSFKIIKKAFNLVTESLVVNLLDDNLTPNYPKEDFVFYHNAKKMQEFGITIAKKVDIKYSPNPIPQKEFNLILYK